MLHFQGSVLEQIGDNERMTKPLAGYTLKPTIDPQSEASVVLNMFGELCEAIGLLNEENSAALREELERSMANLQHGELELAESSLVDCNLWMWDVGEVVLNWIISNSDFECADVSWSEFIEDRWDRRER